MFASATTWCLYGKGAAQDAGTTADWYCVKEFRGADWLEGMFYDTGSR